MRKYLILSFIIATAFNLFGQGFYDINSINTIEITFPYSNWDDKLDSLVSDGNEHRLLGSVIVNGIEYDSVGIRYKGNSSYNSKQKKNPFNIKLDYIIDDQEHDGYGTLKLSNIYKDPSFVREVLSYEIARQYMPASRANFAKITVNEEYIGLYSNVQDVDKHFMRTHFHSSDNPCFKGELVGNGGPTLVKAWGYFGTDSADYTNYYEIESDKGWSDLINFLDVLNNSTEDVDQVLNIDRHLWMLAFDNLLVNLDAPINFAHNYYLYQDDASRFNPIIWDLNESFGVFSRLLSGGNLNTSGLQRMDPFLNITNSYYPIIKNILSNPTYKKIYVAHMQTIIKEYFSNSLYRTRALEIQSIIDEAVQNDPNKFFSYSKFLDNIDNSIGGDGSGTKSQSTIGIAELMEARMDYLSSVTEFMVNAPIINSVSHNLNQNSIATITAAVNDAQVVELAYRNSQTEVFEKIKMFDDGNHNDGTAADGVYGIDMEVSGELQYYIFAENDDAVTLSPERAEYQFYSIETTGTIVINEFLADNETVIADSENEFEDWIELYNNSDADISLQGYYLSDDGNDLAQWAFPDTFIAAKDYLIIWADKDDDQPGLHCNFKLSASGEGIYLSDSNQNIINEVLFNEQETDISMGRYPNGTGGFFPMEPSFGLTNNNGLTDIADDKDSRIPTQFTLAQNYPNPFNPTTTISFSLPENDKITLEIYNSIGQKVAILADHHFLAGRYDLQWDAQDFASGIYIYTLKSSNRFLAQKMILLK